MERIRTILLALIFSLTLTSVAPAQEAYKMRQAEKYRREAEYYSNQANDYRHKAEYYLRRAEDYQNKAI